MCTIPQIVSMKHRVKLRVCMHSATCVFGVISQGQAQPISKGRVRVCTFRGEIQYKCTAKVNRNEMLLQVESKTLGE
jgi:hypothetical protein